jgi:A/G-specific adenine glycosylase
MVVLVIKGNIFMQHSLEQLTSFKDFIWAFYRDQGRIFAWRNNEDPYVVVVSEIMLQQTQTYRVAPKFELFMNRFPTFQALAESSLQDVLSAWQGLGYNRRALALQAIAQYVVSKHGGQLPNDPEVLITFKGIGPATAASICAFAFNRPTVFIETNIRAVFIDSFFKGRDKVDDKELVPLVQATLDHENAREWYYALMDYGVYLKKEKGNPSRKSKHHTKQSRFEGSDRQVRGAIVRAVTHFGELSESDLFVATKEPDQVRFSRILAQLTAEGFVIKKNDLWMIG